MTEIEALFCDRIYTVLGKYVPNDITLNNFSSFMYREFLNLFRDVGVENIVSEIELAGRNEILDVTSFEKSLKDISLFMSENFMVGVLRKTIADLKNQIPMVEREKVVVREVKSDSKSHSITSEISDNYEFDKNVGFFDIDLSAVSRSEDLIGKSNSKKRKSKIADNISKIMEVDRNVFNGVDLSGEESRAVKLKKNMTFEDRGTQENVIDEDLTMDASYLTSGGYKSVPKVSIDLDY